MISLVFLAEIRFAPKDPHKFLCHDQVISGIDWSARSNRIVTASHDRNSYVWNLEGSEWVPTLVILRLNRAALCVQWSPKGVKSLLPSPPTALLDYTYPSLGCNVNIGGLILHWATFALPYSENKFAVGSGAKTVCVCYYEQENNWWVSKLIRKRHDSSVTSVSWHPDNILLATTSTDGKCRVFSTLIKGVDAKDSKKGTSSDSKFGELIVQLDLSSSWTFGVKWSPSGNTLAYAGHNSMIYFVDDVGPSPLAQNVVFRDLPLRDVLFVSERKVIGVGFDCNPMVFAADERGIWSFVRYLGERKAASSGPRYGSQFSEAFGKFYGQSKHGVSNDAVETSRARGTVHENCINCIMPLGDHGTLIRRFSTSGLDGRIVVWDLENEQDLLEL
ncbi:hypothetical protein JHK87_049546 [Glycine soja]|nr:hypothetical protein JHK87_049546 [Glycine soja]